MYGNALAEAVANNNMTSAAFSFHLDTTTALLIVAGIAAVVALVKFLKHKKTAQQA